MATILIKRGLQANISGLVLQVGELAVATDTGNVYVGTEAGSRHLNPTGGEADTALRLTNARSFSATGDATAPAVSFDGTGNVELALTLASQAGLAVGTYTKLTVNEKGIVTAADNISVTDVAGLGTAATVDTGTATGNAVIVGSDGKIDSSLLPALAVTDVFEAADEAGMLALSAEQGDICVRSDEGKTYILKAEPATNAANWIWLQTPDCGVVSVAGKTGAVVLAKEDVGLDQVDNTADEDKVVAEAHKLTTARTISLAGGATGSAIFDGSENATITVEELDASSLVGDVDGGTF